MLLKELSSLASPLSEQQVSLLQQATAELSVTQLAWVSGYLAGVGQNAGQLAPLAQAQPAGKLTILYASQTGNAKGVAEELHAAAQAQDINAEVVNVADYKAKSLKNETHLLIVASTNGEGEPPDDAIEFHEFLASKKAPKLDNLKYSVLALGDSSYEFFCQTGKDFDERLAALGAERVCERVDCDVDYDKDAANWTEQALAEVKQTLSAETSGSVVSLPVSALAASQYNKKNPYAAELSLNQKITGRDSAKDVRHVEIDLADSGLQYQAGDALGVWFENDRELVAKIIARLGLKADELVSIDEQEYSLADALTEKLEITQTSGAFVEAWAAWSASKKLQTVVANKDKLREYAANHQVIDVLLEKKAKVIAQDFVDALRKITPRLYSIASAQAEVEDEVHLTVGVVSYQQGDEQRLGGASGFLGARAEEGAQVKVFVEHNDNFRLPSNPDTPVIMVGPGTGIAPFRAFMQQRDASDAEGKNWLFFGDQTFTQDFLYQTEWQGYLKSGLLSKLDVAFSRDQADKIYVQDRLRENAEEVFQWLEEGAHLYICGDANRMAKDVHQALIDIIAEQGKQSPEQAEEYLKQLRSAKRYQKDVY
ncbi:assimilatory sulfite reductase (NADPH) flavoprotein subunit [Agarivorans aestuarii]|uniref:Sulfite reductase [NADPH] flavoprotein alpha-component n=1 Tax=Agarivorans aestuarii TaxID=1563703 RepID=A0ABU7G7R1_9ALTE|nr:assimilatory sulfite reductase (NADPH) flavoprotein subunit [Agarivorans aestuarii]MEE1675338.1 assimilatory sulfite reductase (NADPH) flavoprotein subunit [Agarivorans aestuarii]